MVDTKKLEKLRSHLRMMDLDKWADVVEDAISEIQSHRQTREDLDDLFGENSQFDIVTAVRELMQEKREAETVLHRR